MKISESSCNVFSHLGTTTKTGVQTSFRKNLNALSQPNNLLTAPFKRHNLGPFQTFKWRCEHTAVSSLKGVRHFEIRRKEWCHKWIIISDFEAVNRISRMVFLQFRKLTVFCWWAWCPYYTRIALSKVFRNFTSDWKCFVCALRKRLSYNRKIFLVLPDDFTQDLGSWCYIQAFVQSISWISLPNSIIMTFL